MVDNKSSKTIDNNCSTDAIAVVVGKLPNARFKLQLLDQRIIEGFISGKIRTRRIHIQLGDKVKVDHSGRIIYRFLQKDNVK
ncbi:hypothetical protein RS022_06920 [Candidatus Phytoplasma rubi]|uniref:Translation initiation factor IF-1 n=2 Tax=16SrV (Elm yellows group) TaxID=85625 RepID=Q14RR4_PHYVT|nr:translation initiation factor IF-1 [Candidatus Phytoplasma rubi]WAN63521.1 hypothetical protein RS022_06920 [Candidatus Phytoplasma rubi]CAJ87492.1 translation initiation factor IF-1 [Candidatus Phytoplasma vitis]